MFFFCFCAQFFMHASSKRMCLYGLIIGCFFLSISHCTASSMDISIRQPCQSYRRKYFCSGTQNKNYGVFYERMWAIDFEGNFKWNVHWWTKCFKTVGSLLLFFFLLLLPLILIVFVTNYHTFTTNLNITHRVFHQSGKLRRINYFFEKSREKKTMYYIREILWNNTKKGIANNFMQECLFLLPLLRRFSCNFLCIFIFIAV